MMLRPPRRTTLTLTASLVLLGCASHAIAQEPPSERPDPREPLPAQASRATRPVADAEQERTESRGEASDLATLLGQLYAPKALVGDLAAILTADNGTNTLILGGGLGASLMGVEYADDVVFEHFGPEQLDDLSDGLGFVGSRHFLYPALTATFFASRALGRERPASVVADVTQAILLSDLIVTPLKVSVRRMRPDGSNNRSFPSGHTAGAFALAAVIDHHTGPAGTIPAYAFASLMALARVDERRHSFSDVLFGAAIGIVAGRTVVQRGDPGLAPRWRLGVITGPRGAPGAGFTIDF